MKKIPKKIVDMIEQRNALNKEIKNWMKKHIDLEGMNPMLADITKYHRGKEQGTSTCKEWCIQSQFGEDWFSGEYYWETEYEGKFLHMDYEI